MSLSSLPSASDSSEETGNIMELAVVKAEQSSNVDDRAQNRQHKNIDEAEAQTCSNVVADAVPDLMSSSTPTHMEFAITIMATVPTEQEPSKNDDASPVVKVIAPGLSPKTDKKTPPKEDDASEEHESEKVSFRELFRFAERADAGWILLAVLASIVNGVSYPISAIFFGGITDAAGSSESNPSFMDDVIFNCLALGILGIVQFISATVAVSGWTIVAERLAMRTREEFLRRTLHQEIAWFAEKSHALILNRLNKDGSLFASGIGEKMSMLIINVCTMLTGLSLGLYYCWQVAGLFLGSLPVIAVVVVVVVKKLRRVGNMSDEINNRASALALDALDAIRTVTAFGGQDRELNEYRDTLSEAKPFALARGRLKGIMMGAIFFQQLSVMASCFLLGSYLIRNGAISHRTGELLTGGDIFAALFLIVFGLLGIMRLAPALPAISGARSAAHRLYEVIDRASPIDASAKRGITPRSFSGGITFDKVTFSYPGRRRRVLRGFSVKFEAGRCTAIVGASGCGKSTALALIERFFDIRQASAVTAAEEAIEGTGDKNRGAVRIDGIDIADVNLKWWRSKLGYVSQSAQLFSGTVRENIAFGHPGASQKKIERAAKIAHAHTFITELEKGYDTEVGDDGTLLSGGQRQRIALARAIVRDPPVLLLDEVTAALDNESEREVLRALRSVMHKRTTIVVAHRLSTIQNADKIIVMEAGRVCEQGTHKSLLNRKGKYSALISAQKDLQDSVRNPSFLNAPIVDPTVEPTTVHAAAKMNSSAQAAPADPYVADTTKPQFVSKSKNSLDETTTAQWARSPPRGANKRLSIAEKMLEGPLALDGANRTRKPKYIDAEIGDAVTHTGDIESGNPMGLATFLQAPVPVYHGQEHTDMSVETVQNFESVEPSSTTHTHTERTDRTAGDNTASCVSVGSNVTNTSFDHDLDTLRSIPEFPEREEEEERSRLMDREDSVSRVAESLQRALTLGGVSDAPSRSGMGYNLDRVSMRRDRKRAGSFSGSRSLTSTSTGSASTAMSLKKPPKSKTRVKHVPFRRVLDIVRSDRKWIFGGTIAAAVHGCAHPIYAFFMSSMWAVLYDDPDAINDQIFTFAIFIVAAGVAWFLMSFATRACFVVVAERLTYHLRVEAYKSLLTQEMSFFDDPRNSAEVLTSHLENQAAKVNEPLGDSLPTIVRIIVQLAVGITIGALFSWRIALVTLAISPVLIASKFFNSRRKTYADDGNDNRNEDVGAQRIAGEATRHIRTVAAFSLEDSAVERYAKALGGEFKGEVKKGLKTGMKNGVGSLNLYICYAFLAWFGASLIEQEVIEFTDMLRALLVVLLCVSGIGDLGLVALDFRKAREAIDNIFYIIDRKSAIDPSDPSGEIVPDSFDMTTPYKHISFDDVTFKYAGREDNVIERISFELARGGSLAVVGKSGCGKSTIIKLLLRFYEAQQGSVNLNKRDIRSYNLQSLRNQISLVEQSSKLFNRSIRENIRYARPDATDEDVEEAAKVAAVHNDVIDFPEGYDTLCGKGGEKLSGGQKQRVAIARAILKNTQLLLLDEATSALDSQSEAAVQTSLNKLMLHNGHVTTVMIAHRLSTVQHCDCIIVLKEGEIVEVGSHFQLLENYPNGTYARLCRASLALGSMKR